MDARDVELQYILMDDFCSEDSMLVLELKCSGTGTDVPGLVVEHVQMENVVHGEFGGVGRDLECGNGWWAGSERDDGVAVEKEGCV